MSWRMLGSMLLLCLAATVAAQKKEGVEFLSKDVLKAYSAKLKAKEPSDLGGKRTKAAIEQVGDRGNYTYAVLRRDETGEPEVHANWADIFVVEEGSGSVLTGGQVKGGREISQGERRGGEIVAGTRQKIAAGDMLIIPAGIPHQVLVAPGSFVTYLVIKIRKPTDQ